MAFTDFFCLAENLGVWRGTMFRYSRRSRWVHSLHFQFSFVILSLVVDQNEWYKRRNPAGKCEAMSKTFLAVDKYNEGGRRKEEPKNIPWSTWAITDMFLMLCFLSMMARSISVVNFTWHIQNVKERAC